jgi:hypothetical protein
MVSKARHCSGRSLDQSNWNGGKVGKWVSNLETGNPWIDVFCFFLSLLTNFLCDISIRWVTVRIPDMGVHNRRSFELYLHPEQQDDGDMQIKSKDASRTVDPELAIHDSHRSIALTAPVDTSPEPEDHVASASASCISSDRSCDSTTSSRFGPMCAFQAVVDREEAMHTPIPEASSLLLFLQNKHTTAMVTPISQKEMGHAGGSLSNSNNMLTKSSEWGSDLRKAGLVDVPHIVSPLGAIKAGLHLLMDRDGIESAPTEL